ncbi:conserved protein of unknown function [Sterolibacterium denitrificans]|uniref:Circularly permuted type 2 ATP-grasp protein n=1 Tax=Sterolibacterium denitrificans TaxID=157592 RepID=A0A7Z7HRY3_9PROT|nr:hypothetical protein [Sterolibacterium denitrificans]SMB28424.1 conserved protein of unknown function [Sterolibacterium denitrificans]
MTTVKPVRFGRQDCHSLAERLNLDCQCVSLDRQALRGELAHAPDGELLAQLIETDRPHLFSDSTVFVGEENIQRMAALIAAVESVVRLPVYAGHVLAHAPESARHVPRAHGVFLGYDFHLPAAPGGWPQLIEINTNAGGGLLNALLARARRACCDSVDTLLPGRVAGAAPEQLFMEMFLAEWRISRPGEVLRSIAIVDETPALQYLYPEFILFRQLFERHGLEAVICDPRELEWRAGRLWHEGRPIDLVYNRLTDFALEAAGNAALRAAWLADGVVLTPHPHGHALYADKRNLIALCDDELLARWGVAAATRELLAAGIPRTEQVDAAHADALWARRRQLFFKPAGGYGSKAAYRGDKLTRRVFEQIMHGGEAYVAQALAPPSSRQLSVAGVPANLKLDLRNYVYDGQVQLVAARLWQGQTTNFRTPGGGFAPVLAVPCKDLPAMGGL